jgi:hypothetical protein
LFVCCCSQSLTCSLNGELPVQWVRRVKFRKTKSERWRELSISFLICGIRDCSRYTNGRSISTRCRTPHPSMSLVLEAISDKFWFSAILPRPVGCVRLELIIHIWSLEEFAHVETCRYFSLLLSEFEGVVKLEDESKCCICCRRSAFLLHLNLAILHKFVSFQFPEGPCGSLRWVGLRRIKLENYYSTIVTFQELMIPEQVLS